MGIVGCILLLQDNKHQEKKGTVLITTANRGYDTWNLCNMYPRFCTTHVIHPVCLPFTLTIISREASESVRRLIIFLHRKEGFYVGSFHLEPAITIFDPHPSRYEACSAYIISCVDREEPTTGNIARESHNRRLVE